MSKKLRNNKLARQVKKASRERVRVKILSSVIGMGLVLFFAVYIALSLYDQYGSFTITVDKESLNANADGKPTASLILAERADFLETFGQITAKQVPDITNISGEDIPADVDSIDGQHNGDNYFAYTFYLKNNGNAHCSYNYSLNIREVKKEADKIVRIKVYTNGNPVVYARTDKNGNTLPGTTKFATADIVMIGLRENFKINAVDKYTVVIWIEGDDEDSTNEKIGGSIKLSMDFSVDESIPPETQQ